MVTELNVAVFYAVLFNLRYPLDNVNLDDEVVLSRTTSGWNGLTSANPVYGYVYNTLLPPSKSESNKYKFYEFSTTINY